MQIRPLTGGLGAEIIDADIRRSDDFEGVFAAFKQYSVIVMREQQITPEDHIRFAERFGVINVNRFFQPIDGYPQIASVLKEATQTEAVGEMWHTDQSYDEAPAMGSILHAIEVPDVGGDTMFASMGMAYEALSPKFKEMIVGLKAWHSSRHGFGMAAADAESSQDGRIGNAHLATQDNLHPVVIRHPLTGRKGLYVNPDFTTHIEGLSASESAALLEFLYEHCKQPEFQCRVRWKAGDVTMWDNQATWHKAINDYPGSRRFMHRITVEGRGLEAA